MVRKAEDTNASKTQEKETEKGKKVAEKHPGNNPKLRASPLKTRSRSRGRKSDADAKGRKNDKSQNRKISPKPKIDPKPKVAPKLKSRSKTRNGRRPDKENDKAEVKDEKKGKKVELASSVEEKPKKDLKMKVTGKKLELSSSMNLSVEEKTDLLFSAYSNWGRPGEQHDKGISAYQLTRWLKNVSLFGGDGGSKVRNRNLEIERIFFSLAVRTGHLSAISTS